MNRLRSWIAAGVVAGVVVAGTCVVGIRLLANRLLAGRGRDTDAALAWNDRFVILDSKPGGSHRYVLVHVWTTVPDLMQRVDLYCFESAAMAAEPERGDFRFSRQVLSEDLEDNWKRLEGGGYAARLPKKGVIDLRTKTIAVEFDTGPPQLIPVPDLDAQQSCPTRTRRGT